ncbi:hypothetical protein [Aliarcobacter butzleri]|uniref:hypothetical protein n=1 Tax=Aliarcobacter butzleri TaxID=28197 RepID=UPI00062E4F03|nr:hypothetical protein [Aliarcobacter butzleri]KLD96373.1 hypothetical protein AF74_11125 [Aliarcobacter butzleri L349]
MNNIKKVFLGVLLLCSLSSGAFANAYGYIWVAGTMGYYDDIDYGDDKTNYVLKPEFNKGVPDINKIIRIEAKNRMYWDLSTIQDISKEFSTLKKQKICDNARYSFSVFMTNEHPDCSVDNFIKKIEIGPTKGGGIYFELTNPIKARILGYVAVDFGMFMLVEQIDVLKK